jgi:hypothetical protein
VLVKEVTRDVWGWTALDHLSQDLKYALRQVRRSPGYCVIAIITLAFGIGVKTPITIRVPIPFRIVTRVA